MKIGLDVSQMVYRGHGVGRYIEELSRALLTHTPHDYVFFAGSLRQRGTFSLRSRNKPWSQAEWKLIPLPPRLARIVFNHTALPIESLTGPLDLFHASDWTHPTTRCPAVTTVHDLSFRLHPETVPPLIHRAQSARLAKAVASGSHFIADSQSTQVDLQKLYDLPSSRVSVVYPGIADRFTRASLTDIARVKKKYNLPTQFVLALGAKEPRKNLIRLIEATQSLAEPLVIAGRQGWGDQLAKSANVHETGFVEDSDLPALYSAATVFAYPSLYEGFGFPVGEAMACGTPVVTSNVSSLPELAGHAGVLVDPTNVLSIKRGIVEALANSSRYKALGLRQAKKFTWVNCAAAVAKIYEKIIHQP